MPDGDAIVTLRQVKLHLRLEVIPDTVDEFDEELMTMIEAAEGYLASIGCDITTEPVPGALKQAALLLIGDFFSNRELTWGSEAKYSPTFQRLVAPYREIAL